MKQTDQLVRIATIEKHNNLINIKKSCVKIEKNEKFMTFLLFTNQNLIYSSTLVCLKFRQNPRKSTYYSSMLKKTLCYFSIQ